MNAIEKDKSQILAMIYSSVSLKDIEGFYQSIRRENAFGMALTQLEAEELVKVEGDRARLTAEGAKVFQVYGNYESYIQARRKAEHLEKEVKKSTVLSNYLTSARLLFAIIGYILGVLSADQVKSILAWFGLPF